MQHAPSTPRATTDDDGAHREDPSSALAFVAVTALASNAQADLGPVPSCGVTTENAAPFLGSSFVATVHIDNVGNHSGFAPGFELFAPPGVTLGSATVLGTAATVQSVGVLTGGSLANPYTGEIVSRTGWLHLLLVRLPLLPASAHAPCSTSTSRCRSAPARSSGCRCAPHDLRLLPRRRRAEEPDRRSDDPLGPCPRTPVIRRPSRWSRASSAAQGATSPPRPAPTSPSSTYTTTTSPTAARSPPHTSSTPSIRACRSPGSK